MPFIDARDLPGGREIVADLIIVGGGMAGLALARQWAGAARSVAVIESGGKAFDPAVQDLYRGSGTMRGPDAPDAAFDDYVHQSRRRMLGGSGMVWGGKCVALDPADFAERRWVPGSGWPISRSAMQPYYDRACDLLGLAHFPAGETARTEAGQQELRIGDGRRFFSAPRQFTRYSGAVDRAAYDAWRFAPAAAENVTVYLHANLLELKLSADRKALERLEMACLDGKRLTAKGRVYVLATGGIENARLLLASNSVAPEGVGNGHDLVGRNFQGHVSFAVDQRAKGLATGVYFSKTNSDLRLYTDGFKGRAHCVLAPTLAGQRERKAGNFTVTMGPFRAYLPPDAELAALQQLADSLDGRGEGEARDRDLSCFFMTEHMPNPQSRVTLGAASDALGMPRVKLEWRWSEADWRSLESSVAAFSQALGEAGLGRASFPATRADFVAMAAGSPSRHHMGTTRMHRDPTRGVVDADSRVHGVSNLYVAGSSVFPTSGIGNPTLTLLAMTLRLSDHLKAAMRRAA